MIFYVGDKVHIGNPSDRWIVCTSPNTDQKVSLHRANYQPTILVDSDRLILVKRGNPIRAVIDMLETTETIDESGETIYNMSYDDLLNFYKFVKENL